MFMFQHSCEPKTKSLSDVMKKLAQKRPISKHNMTKAAFQHFRLPEIK